ncbi:MAG: sulfatase family protein [Promethearchaeota archaeon]
MGNLKEKPNILFILADQHRFDCFGAYENRDIKTPNLDKIAQDGVVFSNCFATFPVCTPSRYSILTGLYVHQHLGWSNSSTLPSGLPTFPKILKNEGYSTSCVGKMHFTPTYLDVGFDKMILAEQDGPGRYDDDYHRYLMEKGLIDYIDLRDQVYAFRRMASKEYYDNFGTEPSNLPESEYSTTWIGNEACKIIDKWKNNKRGGNLLMVGFIKPHHPHDAPYPWCEMYNPADLSLPPGWTNECLEHDLKFNVGYFNNKNLNEEKIRKIASQYYASISQIDHQIGRMIEILKEEGIYDNTMIIYSSDHGEYLGFHHLVLKGNYMYDPLIKVPLIVKFPESYETDFVKGEIHNGLVSLIDLTASIIDVGGGFIPSQLWNQVTPLEKESNREVIFAESAGGNYMIRTEEWKLLLCKTKKNLLFDLKNDPYELNNLFENQKYKQIVEDLKKKLFNWTTFESVSIENKDPYAKVIEDINVPKLNDGHREKIQNYFKNKMQELYKQNKL